MIHTGINVSIWLIHSLQPIRSNNNTHTHFYNFIMKSVHCRQYYCVQFLVTVCLVKNNVSTCILSLCKPGIGYYTIWNFWKLAFWHIDLPVFKNCSITCNTTLLQTGWSISLLPINFQIVRVFYISAQLLQLFHIYVAKASISLPLHATMDLLIQTYLSAVITCWEFWFLVLIGDYFGQFFSSGTLLIVGQNDILLNPTTAFAWNTKTVEGNIQTCIIIIHMGIFVYSY